MRAWPMARVHPMRITNGPRGCSVRSCLYQHPRDAEQTARFKKSLGGLNTLYAHQETWVWCLSLLPPMLDQQLRPYDSACAHACGKRTHGE